MPFYFLLVALIIWTWRIRHSGQDQAADYAYDVEGAPYGAPGRAHARPAFNGQQIVK